MGVKCLVPWQLLLGAQDESPLFSSLPRPLLVLVSSLSPTLIYRTQLEILIYRPKKGPSKHYHDSEKLFGPPGNPGEKDNFLGRWLFECAWLLSSVGPGMDSP